MHIKKTVLFICFCFTILFIGCRKDAFDAYYGRPAGLASPIYQLLDSMGDFKYFLSCIDKAGYKNTLGSASSWTVFAPTDVAFQKFMSENNISDTSKIDKKLAEQIVRISMVYDGERLEKLTDYFSAKGWVPGMAFRRRTVYYDFVEDETQVNGKIRKIVNTNRNVNGLFVESDNNNKHLTFYFQDYMSNRRLGADDYNSFFSNSNFSGLNIQGANIDPKRNNIIAENGYIHVVDKVLLPEKNIDQYLKGNTQYSEFKSILDLFATYSYNASLSRKYEVLTGNKDSVFVKGYQALSFAPNNENYLKEDANDAQTNSYSVTIPNNEAVRDYAKRVLLKYYPSGTTLKDVFYSNSSILVEYINSHFYNTQLWSSEFATQRNVLGESTKLNRGNVVESKQLSNGAFYGINASQQANVFHSVYGNVLLDPKYSFMRTALERIGMTSTLKLPTLRYMLILVSDNALHDMGFSYDAYNTSDPIRYNGGNGSPEMREILMAHIIPLENYPLPSLSGSGILESYAGEYVKFNAMRMESSGTQDSIISKRTIQIDSISIGNTQSGPLNGQVVYLHGALTSSNTNIGIYLTKKINNDSSSPYYQFYNYLINSDIYSSTDGVIKGVELGLNYTMLIPTNAAITSAIANGDLPAAVNPTDVALREKIKKFLEYHIVRNSFAIDGKKTGTFQTICKDVEGEVQTLQVTLNQVDKLQVKDNVGRVIDATATNSNQLGQRVVVHSIAGYLKHGI